MEANVVPNGKYFGVGVEDCRQPVDCDALVVHAVTCVIDCGGYLPGVSGEVGKGVTVNPVYRCNPDAAVPIDALLNVMALEGTGSGEFVDAVAADAGKNSTRTGSPPQLRGETCRALP